MLTVPSSARMVSVRSSPLAEALSASISSATLPLCTLSPSAIVVLLAPPQPLAGQLVDAGHAHQLHPALDLVLEDAQRALDPGLPRRGERVKIEPPTRGRGRPRRQRFQHMRAAAHPAVADH